MPNLYKKPVRRYAKKSAYKRIKAKEAKRGAKERYRLFGMGNNGSNTIIRNPAIKRIHTVDVVKTINSAYVLAGSDTEFFQQFNPFATPTPLGPMNTYSLQFNQYAQTYDQYKVKKIRITARCVDNQSGQANPIITARYNYDVTIGSSGYKLVSDFLDEAENVKEHYFTYERPCCFWDIVPKVDITTATSSAFSSAGRKPQKMGWTDIDYPIMINGFCLNTTNIMASACKIVLDITYWVSFKYQI